MNTPLFLRCVLCLAAVSFGPQRLGAQTPSLDMVEELVVTARADLARAALVEWWAEARPGASRRTIQRALWLRGRLTVDPSQAVMDFRRLVIEYPGGPYTDLALYRLAQAAHVLADEAGAAGYLAALGRDYPRSPVRARADEWFAVARSSPMRAAARSGDDSVRSANAQENGESPRAAQPESTSVAADRVRELPANTLETTREQSVTLDAAPKGRYAVQLGAFAEEARARAQLARAGEAGLEPRLVRVSSSRLLHVRVGRFDSSRAASVFLRTVTDLGFTAAVVRDATEEEPVRG